MEPFPSKDQILDNTPVLPELKLHNDPYFDEFTETSSESSPQNMPSPVDLDTPIYRCPLEVLGYILSLAFTDDGSTARSLSVVSRHIYEVSKFYRFQSVACRNAAQTLAFAAVLEKTPPNLRVVRNLFISNSHNDELPPESVTKETVRSSTFRTLSFIRLRHQLQRSSVVAPNAKIPAETRVYTAICQILVAAAPSLRTLSLYLDWDSWVLLPMPAHLPVLVELSLNHQFQYSNLCSEAFIPLRSYPALRRLILTGFRRIIDPDAIIIKIQTFAPSITHLCLPEDAENIWELLTELKGSMNAPSIRIFPKTLEYLVVHAPGFWHIPIGFKEFGLGDQRVVFIPRPWDRKRRNDVRQQWEKEWMDRTSCGEGYWKMDDRYYIDWW